MKFATGCVIYISHYTLKYVAALPREVNKFRYAANEKNALISTLH